MTASWSARTLSRMGYRVALKKCTSYDISEIVGVVRDALTLVEFNLNSVKDKTVLLKPNMLGAYLPDRHVTTHPAFVEACASIFKEAGARVQVGDSSNGVYEPDEVWNVIGLRVACERAGVEMVPFERAGSVEKNGLRLSKALDDANLIVNLPKFKTHGLTGLTVAAKNLYGCVPGMVKTTYHRKHMKQRDFASCVVDIAQTVGPQLTIVDGIIGMEGNGPSGGKLAHLGFIMMSADLHAIDAVSCKLAGLEPRELDTLDIAHERGLFDVDAAIEIKGETIEACKPTSFELPSSYIKKKVDSRIAQAVLGLIWRVMKVRPVIAEDRCKKCGLCIKSCPVDAISWRGNPGEKAPLIYKKKCIRCFCCHEVCPYTAIDMKRSLAVQLLQRMSKKDVANES